MVVDCEDSLLLTNDRRSPLSHLVGTVTLLVTGME